MPGRLIAALGLGAAFVMAMPFLLLGAILGLIFGSSWFLMIGVVPMVAFLAMFWAISRRMKAMAMQGFGGDPALRRSGVRTVATVQRVQAMPTLMTDPNNPHVTVAVDILVEPREGQPYRAQVFRRMGQGMLAPRPGDRVTVYVHRRSPGMMFADWDDYVQGESQDMERGAIDVELLSGQRRD
jgi:hypothetical protein